MIIAGAILCLAVVVGVVIHERIVWKRSQS